MALNNKLPINEDGKIKKYLYTNNTKKIIVKIKK